MKRLLLTWLATSFLLACSTTDKNGWSGGEASQKLQTLLNKYWEFRLQEDPVFATITGDHRYDDQLGKASLADHQRRGAVVQQMFDEFNKIDQATLSEAEQINYFIIKTQLAESLEEQRFRSYLMPISGRSGFHIEFPELSEQMSLATKKDYENYVSRLRQIPQYFDEQIEVLREGVKSGITPPKVIFQGYEEALTPHTTQDLQKNAFYKPFLKFPKQLASVDQEFLRAQGADAVLNSVVPAYEKFAAFMKAEYFPGTRTTIGISELPNGKNYYAHRARVYTTLPLTPEQIHQTGLQEVERIQSEMLEVIKKTPQAKMTLKEFIGFLRKSSQFHFKTPEDLLKETAWILKRAEGELPHLFGRLPRLPVGIKEVPAYIAPKTTTAYYDGPPGDGTRAGFYYVNTSNLPSRPSYEIEALTLHEAVPGHHLQIALQQELMDLPVFRRFTFYTAFVEGWALYAERLGLEMGFYTDPYRDFGRLTYEMWRACRLVVDTGIHSMGWTREKAIQFLANHTALSLHNVETEVDRYIGWPGQALAYKMGELKIRELRSLAEKSLGESFNLRAFHDQILSGGSLPLDLIEQRTHQYIARTKANRR